MKILRRHDFKATSFYPDSSEYSTTKCSDMFASQALLCRPDKEPFIAGITVEEIPGTKQYRELACYQRRWQDSR